MKVFLIHGGLWDGWCIVERDNGETRLVRSITPEDFMHIGTSASMEDITPDNGRDVSTPATKARAEALGLTIIHGGV